VEYPFKYTVTDIGLTSFSFSSSFSFTPLTLSTLYLFSLPTSQRQEGKEKIINSYNKNHILRRVKDEGGKKEKTHLLNNITE